MSMCNRRREKRKVEGSRKIITAQRTKEQNSWVNLKTIHFASDDLPPMNFSRRYTTQDWISKPVSIHSLSFLSRKQASFLYAGCFCLVTKRAFVLFTWNESAHTLINYTCDILFMIVNVPQSHSLDFFRQISTYTNRPGPYARELSSICSCPFTHSSVWDIYK